MSTVSWVEAAMPEEHVPIRKDSYARPPASTRFLFCKWVQYYEISPQI